MINVLAAVAPEAALTMPGANLSRSLLDASADCIKVLGLEGNLEYMNVNGLCLMEIEDFDPIRGRHWSEMWPDEQREVIQSSLATARAGGVARFNADCPTGKGTMKSWEVIVSPVLDENGRPSRLVSVSRDVTERQRTEQDNALLALEMAHRIKNMFAVVDGVVSLSARSAPEAKDFAASLRSRLQALGRAVAYVTPPEIRGDSEQEHTLQGLLHVLLEPYGHTTGADARVTIEGDDLAVGSRATTAIALIVNELATNALKYGALGEAGGQVRVSVRTSDDAAEVTWLEAGLEFEQLHLEGAGGFGTTLIDNAVLRQLNGTLTREWTATGLLVRLHLALARLAN